MRIFFVVALLLVHTVCFSEEGETRVGVKDLRMAILAGDAEKIDLLVEAGLSKELLTSNLMYAISWNYSPKNIDVIRALIRNGANIESLKGKKRSYLHIVIRNADYELLKLLINENSDLSVTENSRNLLQSAIHMTYGGNAEQLKDINYRRNKIIQYLIDLEVFKLDSESLFFAMDSSQDPAKSGVLQLLVDNGLDVNEIIRSDIIDFKNPFFYAARQGHLKSIDYFLEQGVDLAYQSKTGEIILYPAIRQYNSDVLEYLLKYPKLFTEDQLKKAAEFAMDMGSKNELVNLLLTAGAKPGLAYVCDTCIYQSNSWPGEGIPVFYANKQNIMLYEQPIVTSEKTLVKFIIGKRIIYGKTVLRTIESVMLTARKKLTDFHCGKEKIEVNFGDTIEYLQYRAEGYGTVRIKGVVCELQLDNTILAGLEMSPKTEWWIHILNNKQQPLGWYLLGANSGELRSGDREF